MENIVSLFTNLSVPVACLVATFWLWNKEREEHKSEMDKVTEALNNNTLALEKLITMMGMGEK